jgi:DNA modification methylase
MDDINNPLKSQLELFDTEIDETFIKNLKGVTEFRIPASKIRAAMSPDCRDEVFRSLELETQPTDRYSQQNRLNDLPGRVWIQETKSIWRQKGLGSGHPHACYERLHPAPFSYQDVGRLIRFFTKKGEQVLDPFCGMASTLKACAILNRKGIGVELSPKWVELAEERLAVELGASDHQEIICGDVRDVLPSFDEEQFQFVVTSPPYWNILTKDADHKVKETRLSAELATHYSESEHDLGNIEAYEVFLEELVLVFRRISAKVENQRYMAIIVSDFRHKSRFYPFHSDLYQKLCNQVIRLVGVTILEQTHKKLYPYGYPFTYIPNFHHQYILLFQIFHRS